MAAGKTYGIAPNADLFLVKIRNGCKNKFWDENRQTHLAALQPEALDWVIQKVQAHILRRLSANSNARSVINMSWGKQKFFSYCDLVVTNTNLCRRYQFPRHPNGANVRRVLCVVRGTQYSNRYIGRKFPCASAALECPTEIWNRKEQHYNCRWCYQDWDIMA